MNSGRIERLLKLILALESRRPQTVDELAARVEVSRRTIFRDLEILTQAGLQYTYDRDNKRYTALRSMLLPPVTLTHGEALALLLAVKATERRADLVDQPTAISAGMKLESMLPAVLRDEVGSILPLVEVRGEPNSDTPSIQDTLSMIQSALSGHHVLRVRYDSYFERKTIDVILHPYRLAYIHRAWYLIAYSLTHAEIRTFKVERVLRIRKMAETFSMDHKFNLDEYFGNAWLMIRGDKSHHVKIRFLPRVAGNVDEISWHKTQQTLYEPDGSLLFEVDVDGLDEISWWILGYGDQAQVLEPPRLKEIIASRVKGMYDHYHPDGLTTTNR